MLNLDSGVERLVGLGATVVARHIPDEGFGWVTLADPHGQVFDIASGSSSGA